MPTITLTESVSVGGISVQGSAQRTVEGQIGQEVSVPAAKVGQLTTRTDDDSGVITMAADHGIVSTDIVDIYWAGGVRYGCEATVSVNALTVNDDGAGAVLPTNLTAVTVCKRVVIDCDFDADLMVLLAMSSNTRSHVDIRDSGGTELAVELTANEPHTWVSGYETEGAANPLSGDTVDAIHVSNGDSTAAATIKIGVAYDSAA